MKYSWHYEHLSRANVQVLSESLVVEHLHSAKRVQMLNNKTLGLPETSQQHIGCITYVPAARVRE